MEIVENTLDVPIHDFLNRPLFSFLAQRSDEGPRVSPLWFDWDGDSERMWHIAELAGRSYPERVQSDPRTAIAVVDFDATIGRVEHVGMRGRASLESFDREVANALLETYLGEDRTAWPDRFTELQPGNYKLLTVEPETVVARDQSYDAPGRSDSPGT